MGISFDRALGVHPEALALRARRAEVIAGNLANADTPGYLARDLPFEEMLAGEVGPGLSIARSNAHHLTPASGDRELGLRFRTPTQPAVDGNTVDSDQEIARFAENSVAFEASFSFLSARFRTLSSAIRGD